MSFILSIKFLIDYITNITFNLCPVVRGYLRFQCVCVCVCVCACVRACVCVCTGWDGGLWSGGGDGVYMCVCGGEGLLECS